MQGHQPGLLTQFDCSENRATMHGGGRDYGRCLHLTLRWFECGNPNLPERPRSPPMESTAPCVPRNDGVVGWAKARFAPCPPSSFAVTVVGTLRLAHPTAPCRDS